MADTLLAPETPPTPAPETPPAPAPEAGAATDWRASLPEELRGEKMFESIKGKDAAEALPVLAKSYRDAQKLVGGSLGKLPEKGATPEQIQAWKDANLGKLAEAGLIELPPGDGKYTAKMNLPAGMSQNDAALQSFLSLAQKQGLTNTQVQAVLDFHVAQLGSAREALGGSAKQTMATLEKEWGAAAKHNVAVAQRAVSELGGSELIEVLNESGLGNHPALIMAFARIGRILAEDDPAFAEMTHDSVAEAKGKHAAILNDPKHPYWQPDAPGHKDAVKEVKRLNEIIYNT